MGSAPTIRSTPTWLALLALAALFVTALAFSARAQADTILWNNYRAEPETIGFANIDGTGGGALNLGAVAIENPEGMAYDTVTNRLFVAHDGPSGDGAVIAINLDGSGASNFTAPGAPLDGPEGVAIDPLTRTIYWINNGSTPPSISWANLDGSGSGTVNLAGTTLKSAYRLAIDPVAGRLYWGNNTMGEPPTLGFAAVNGSGGGLLPAPGLAATSATGIAVDPAGGKLYLADSNSDKIFFINLNGTGAGEVFTGGGSFDEPYGVALDPTLGRLYWGNYGKEEVRNLALGTALVAGGGGGITIATAPVDSPQDPVILKAPSAAGAPVITRAKSDRSKLTCPTGSWGADFPGSFVYQAPRGYAYQWELNGKALSGAVATTLFAKKPGKYTCTVTATNQGGTAAQTSAAVRVKASKAKLTTKKKVTVRAGGTATFTVKVNNQGDLKSKNAKVCVQLPKAAKGFLKPSKCKSLGKLKGKGKRSAKLKIKALPSASGVYRVTFKAKGVAGKAAKAKIVVNG